MVAQVEPAKTPAKVTPLVPWLKLPHAFVDELYGRVSSDAYGLAIYLVRHTAGYGHEYVEQTDAELMAASRLPRRTFQRAKAELRAANIFAMERREATRGKPTVYTLASPAEWSLEPKGLCATLAHNSEPDGLRANMAHNGSKPQGKPAEALRANMAHNPAPSDYAPKLHVLSANVAHNSAQQNAHVEPAAPETKPPRHASQRESYSNRKEKKETYMASPADSLPTKSSTPPTKTPKTADPKAEYTQALVTALQEQIGAKLPSWARERKAAEWYYTAGKDGAPAPIADVMACYAATKADEWWAGKYLGLDALKPKWTVWVAPKPATSTQARSAARSGPRTATATPVRAAPAMLTPEMASPWD